MLRGLYHERNSSVSNQRSQDFSFKHTMHFLVKAELSSPVNSSDIIVFSHILEFWIAYSLINKINNKYFAWCLICKVYNNTLARWERVILTINLSQDLSAQFSVKYLHIAHCQNFICSRIVKKLENPKHGLTYKIIFCNPHYKKQFF